MSTPVQVRVVARPARPASSRHQTPSLTTGRSLFPHSRVPQISGEALSRAGPMHLPSARAFVVYPVFANIIVAPPPAPPSRLTGTPPRR